MIKITDDNVSIKIKNLFYKTEKDVLKTFVQEKRHSNGLMFYIKGGHKFKMASGEEFCTSDGDLLYLPYGSKYTNSVVRDGIEYYQINFTLMKGNEEIVFLDECKVIPKRSAEKYFDYFPKIINSYTEYMHFGEIHALNQLLALLSALVKDTVECYDKETGWNKIAPSVEYINSHYAENTPVEMLAQIANTSISRLEKNFIRYIKKTPIAYRNSIRIEKAKLLLQGGFSIAEVAERVGFSDMYYFAKTFKKITGTTPGAFLKTKTGVTRI